MVSFKPRPLYPRYPLIRLGGPQRELDSLEKRNISCPCQESNPGLPTRSLSLYRVNYPCLLNCVVYYSAEVVATSFGRFKNCIRYRTICSPFIMLGVPTAPSWFSPLPNFTSSVTVQSCLAHVLYLARGEHWYIALFLKYGPRSARGPRNYFFFPL
jgi:hypothetical protein